MSVSERSPLTRRGASGVSPRPQQPERSLLMMADATVRTSAGEVSSGTTSSTAFRAFAFRRPPTYCGGDCSAASPCGRLRCRFDLSRGERVSSRAPAGRAGRASGDSAARPRPPTHLECGRRLPRRLRLPTGSRALNFDLSLPHHLSLPGRSRRAHPAAQMRRIGRLSSAAAAWSGLGLGRFFLRTRQGPRKVPRTTLSGFKRF